MEKPKTLIANARLKKDEYQVIKDIAKEYNVKRSVVIRTLIIHALKDMENKP
jgi:hypothetical protein